MSTTGNAYGRARPTPWIGFHEDVYRVWCEHPNLGVHGFAVRPPLRQCDDLVDQVADVVAWMSESENSERLVEKISSYRLKHLVEARTRRYCSNGAALVACLVTGLEPLPPRDPSSPNRRFRRSSRNCGFVR
ncbi:hypothetical protein J7E70_30250 [Variovorax paradoxus]|nr:hypothetical protein [Variovorax paradoxus]MBT2304704.1 hypothetical protein [Variovorax paradoxus]